MFGARAIQRRREKEEELKVGFMMHQNPVSNHPNVVLISCTAWPQFKYSLEVQAQFVSPSRLFWLIYFFLTFNKSQVNNKQQLANTLKLTSH